MSLASTKSTGQAFLQKFGNDWCTNLAGMLAYNFLGAIFPLLLGILALAALVLPSAIVQRVGASLNEAIPAGANGQNGLNIDFNSVLASFHHSNASVIALIASFAALIWTGSSLFGVMENCFSLIYRTKDRTFVRQKLMSLAMIGIFVVLTPLAFVASIVSGFYAQITKGLGDVPGLGVLLAAGGYVLGVVIALALFLLIYTIVPNLPLGFAHAWRGAIVAAVLFEAVSLAFPIYTTHFASTSQFGSIAGLLAVLTLWFWVISLILLLGAEVNSFFALGQRATADDLPGVLKRVVEDVRLGPATPAARVP